MKVYSFDVFDTCLIRNVAVPTDIFLLVAEEFESLLVPTLGPDYRLAFRNCRERAEDWVRTQSSSEDITLEEIWTELVLRLPMIERDTGMAVELAAEQAALKPNRTILERVKELADTGARVIFISDTYLSRAQVLTFLRNAGFPAREENVYTSGDAGVLKATGSLFHHVFAKEGCFPRDLVHTGDSATGDVSIPRKLGVKVRHVTETRLNRFELALLNQAGSQDSKDMLFVSRLVGEMRRFRLDGLGTPQEAAHDIVAAFLGPVLVIYASWLAKRTKAHGIDRLLFTSRDCYRLHRMAKKMPQHFETMNCLYFYASRQAVHLAALPNATQEEIRLITHPGKPKKLVEVLRLFGLTAADAGKYLSKVVETLDMDQTLRSRDAEEAVIEVLSRSPLRERIMANAVEHRKRVLGYFEGEGLLEGGRVAFIDLGWHLTKQISITTLLRHFSASTIVHGFYLGMGKKHPGFSRSGPAEAAVHAPAADRMCDTELNVVFEQGGLIEALLGGAPHGTVMHYDFDSSGAISPICEVNDASTPFCEDLTLLCEQFALRLDADLNERCCVGVSRMIGTVVRESVQKPEKKWLSAIENITVSDDSILSGGYDIPIHRPYEWREILLGYSRPRPWPELSMMQLTTASRCTYRCARFLRKHLGSVVPKFVRQSVRRLVFPRPKVH